jgi:prephenate dehydrogenase
VNAFTRYFASKDHFLKLYDINFEKAKKLAHLVGSSWESSIEDTVCDADLVLVCTPIKVTQKILFEAAEKMRPGSLLCEIASLKQGIVQALKQLGNVTPLSIHPMFGPDVPGFKDQKIAVIPVKNPDAEMRTATSLFPMSKLIRVEAECHDRAMAIILSLPYFMNLVFAKILPEEMDLVKTLAGTTFSAQLALTQCVVGESPELVEALVNENKHTWNAVNSFIDEAHHLRRIAKNPNLFKEYCLNLESKLRAVQGFENAREFRKKLLEGLE